MSSTHETSVSDREREFETLYRFLRYQLPLHFNHSPTGREPENVFGVGEEVDDDLIASFFMTYDQFSERVPLAIQSFLKTLAMDWVVYGSFGIKHPFNSDGSLNRSPRFVVTRTQIAGELDMRALESRRGNELRRSTN